MDREWPSVATNMSASFDADCQVVLACISGSMVPYFEANFEKENHMGAANTLMGRARRSRAQRTSVTSRKEKCRV
jgi:hypothetical protein